MEPIDYTSSQCVDINIDLSNFSQQEFDGIILQLFERYLIDSLTVGSREIFYKDKNNKLDLNQILYNTIVNECLVKCLIDYANDTIKTLGNENAHSK